MRGRPDTYARTIVIMNVEKNTAAEKEMLINLAQEKAESFKAGELKKLGFLPLDDPFFLSVHYPPRTMYPACNESEVFAGFKYNKPDPLAIYIHIPFCLTKCTYCHFATSLNKSPEDIDYYLIKLKQEMGLWKSRLETDTVSPRLIYIGGGTPSMLSPAQLDRFFNSLEESFDLSKCNDISLEAEPMTLLGKRGDEKLRILKKNGVDRIYLGVQAFDDGMLKMMGRRHTYKDAIEVIKKIRRAGFKSLSIDLIYGYPGCTQEIWMKTLETAYSLDIDSYQLYRLCVIPYGPEEGAISNQYARSSKTFPGLNQQLAMDTLGRIIAEQNGFKEYLREIFSRSIEHNSCYSMHCCGNLYNVLGLGLSAWSSFSGRFTLNVAGSLEKYYSYINKGKLPIDRGKIRTRDDEKRREIVMPLKNCGVSKIRYERRTGLKVNEAFGKKIRLLKDFGLLKEDDKRLVLTEKGELFSNEVAMQFYNPRYLPFPKSSYADGILNPYNP